MKNLCYTFLVLILWACAEQPEPRPKDILTPDEFTAVMIDVQISEGMKTQKVFVTKDNPSNAPQLYARLLEKHNISDEKFKKTYDYYRERPAEMEKVYEQVLDSLSKLEAEVKQEFSTEMRAQSDSIQAAAKRRRDSLKVNLLRK